MLECTVELIYLDCVPIDQRFPGLYQASSHIVFMRALLLIVLMPVN
jgi:hypothetical protein